MMQSAKHVKYCAACTAVQAQTDSTNASELDGCFGKPYGSCVAMKKITRQVPMTKSACIDAAQMPNSIIKANHKSYFSTISGMHKAYQLHKHHSRPTNATPRIFF